MMTRDHGHPLAILISFLPAWLTMREATWMMSRIMLPTRRRVSLKPLLIRCLGH